MDNTRTAQDLIEELSKLPPDSVIAFPVQWTYETANELWSDALVKPLTQAQWAEVAELYIESLSKFFWEDSELAMQEVLNDKELLKEEW